MGITLIDTETIHEVTIGGTIFKVRAMDAYDRIKMASIMSKLTTAAAGLTLTRADWDGLVEILDRRVDAIDGFSEKLKTLKAMVEADVATLAAEIFKLSTLPEAERKNS